MHVKGRHIFLIGPGGVGKSTVGPYLAQNLCLPFHDLDDYFCANISNIRSFIAQYGYGGYVRQNSYCFFDMMNSAKHEAVFALSSGFLIEEKENQFVKKTSRLYVPWVQRFY
ncbi:Shikimate kinase [Pseudovibrio axinellae]|uniref:Shikimate kinase n=1 Tax=Pseudovibrio axinellae TaxID=989403 RepID=A0A165ZNG8_9HYPH|nr:shikimate kinase [Pseudovibrio axinellae]KZL20091.1 Shikimate kinase [Pseudovibrio axinellae]SEQ25739.1 shikimate kinase [Pseudovibrio axinellae]